MTHASVNLSAVTVTRDDALTAAARIWAEARARRDALPAREAALAAYVPGGKSVDELTELIQAQRDRARAKLASSTAA